MDADASGPAVGRNVRQGDHLERILDALERVAFEGASLEELLVEWVSDP